MAVAAVTRRVKWADMNPLPDNPIQMSRLARIEREGGFRVESVGTPELALNDLKAFPDLAEDAYVLIDGHHRRELYSRANGNAGPDDVICKIHRGLTREEIEQRFLDANDYRLHPVNEIFVHRVAAGEKVACDINKIILEAGFHVPAHTNGRVKNAIAATNAVEWVYHGGNLNDFKIYPALLTRTLQGMRIMYGNDANVTKGNLIKGVGLFHRRYGDAVDIDRLHKNLPGTYKTVADLLGAAERFREALRKPPPEAVAYTVRLAYNGNRRSKHDLPEWR